MDEAGKKHEREKGGFLSGLVLGAALALFLSTKKGRELLRNITEDGFDKLSNIEEVLRSEFEDEEEKTEPQPLTVITQEKPQEKTEKKEVKKLEESPKESSALYSSHPSGRRFFKGVPKKHNY